ncbi:sorbitol dehydrogenase [Knoellia flava TL1]|uniref:Sorbitol dehydrogenase n=2 Tax=Knoellia flava TaxID=913969 RepID=A0A8H9KSB3_9MICO|nr:NAD(P)-dependent alcohol dehydrogenase [Knoellia flava]KGN35976.1 sorbitol dehydrogenase [Knoellia flava TL1]GGB78985.1 sorbitol dehydrogenase [Knoellia flava]
MTSGGPLDTMRVAVLAEPGSIAVESRPVPSPRPDEVLIEVRSVGVCGSDTHYYDHGRIGDHVVTGPLVLGHESAGVIVAVGAKVDPARVGERVAIEPGVPCRSCAQCLSGHYNLCPDMVFHATPPVDGTLAEYVTHPAAFAFALPDSVSLDEGAMLEPLSVGIWACRRAGVAPGVRVLVTGAGPVGQLAAQVASAYGASEVVVADVNAHRLSVARDLGATEVVDVSSTSLSETYAGRPGPDVVLECSGHEGSTQAAIRVAAPAARVVLIGMGGDTLALPLGDVQNRELWVTGVFRYANTWPTAIDLVASGRVRLAPLATGHFELEETAAALTAARDDAHAIKSVIHPHGRPTGATTTGESAG